MKKLPRSFYLRPTVSVAKDLLGKYIVRRYRSKTLIGKIVETEAYCTNDVASHSYRGRTTRNEVMFWNGGHLYVYFTYGMHFCSNVVTRQEGVGEAVLLRAVEPLEGVEVMMKQRGFTADKKDKWMLTNGPAKLCQAFVFGRAENGTDLLSDDVFITQGEPVRRAHIQSSARIGIQNGLDKRWRFYIRDNRFVSR